MINIAELHGGIHTIEIIGATNIAEIPNIPELNNISRQEFKKLIPVGNGENAEMAHSFYGVINVNKHLGNNQYYKYYSDYIVRLTEILELCELIEYKITRVDYYIDNYNNSFDSLLQLNQAFIYTLGVALESNNQFTNSGKARDKQSISVKTNYGYIKCYNKKEESGENSPVFIRLELQHSGLKIQASEIQELYNTFWKQQLLRLTNIHRTYGYDNWAYNTMCKDSVDGLARQYKKSIDGQKVKYISEFFRQHRDEIFTAEQAGDLCEKIGTPRATATRYKQRGYIDYILHRDLMLYILYIEIALETFIDSVVISTE